MPAGGGGAGRGRLPPLSRSTLPDLLRRALWRISTASPAWRVVLAASASGEFIMRMTVLPGALGRLQRQGALAAHVLAYGEYAHAAAGAWGLSPRGPRPSAGGPVRCSLAVRAEQRSMGAAEPDACEVARQGAVVVLDRAYEPLRLSGACSLPARALDRAWQPVVAHQGPGHDGHPRRLRARAGGR